MNLVFSVEEMTFFLSVRNYRVAKVPGAYELLEGPITTTEMDEVVVAFKPKEYQDLKDLYWRTDIEAKFGIEEVFKKELKKALLKI